jgi:hypothetical protein
MKRKLTRLQQVHHTTLALILVIRVTMLSKLGGKYQAGLRRGGAVLHIDVFKPYKAVGKSNAAEGSRRGVVFSNAASS